MIGEETNNQYRAYLFDFRGSTVALTDGSGQVTQRFQYSAYGELVSGDATQTPFLFNGMYGVMTDVSGLYYMRARYYSPEIKRFVNQDVLLGEVSEGQSLNRFAFVTGQPVSFVDPWGLIKYCGRCAIGAYDCLLYGNNRCESPQTTVTEIYDYAVRNRTWGHQTYPGEQNSNMRHCVVSCLLASTHGTEVARPFGFGNELQGFVIHDLWHLPSRIRGQTPWAFQLQDLVSNENGFSCAKLNECSEKGTEQSLCTVCCGRHSGK